MLQKLSDYIIYYNNAAIFITGKNQTGDIQSVFIRSTSDMQRFLDRYSNNEALQDIRLVGNNMEEVFRDFVSWFEYIEAAGALVRNKTGNYLLIKRFDIWDLPKGKIEQNEKPESGAKREVTEETGVDGLELIEKLPATYHIYFYREKYVLKKTHWYLMKTNYEGKPVAQADEDITEAVWMNRLEALKSLEESYRSIRDILVPFI